MQVSLNEITTGAKTKSHEVLIRHRQALSSDARDHIFAFYGLSAHDDFAELNIEPNYLKSVESLYKDIAISNIRGTSNLDLLDIPRFARPDKLEIPSWVPDWRNIKDICFSLLQMELGQILTKEQCM